MKLTSIAGKYLKPYQGLKLLLGGTLLEHESAGKYLKPYQGLKQIIELTRIQPSRRKIPKTLSGIETKQLLLDTLLPRCRKIPKTLSGIETVRLLVLRGFWRCRKIPKTLSGIETSCRPVAADRYSAGKYLKPYQGLKLGMASN